MKNRRSFNRLDRKPSHRRALQNNMVTALLRHGRIRTTRAKALEVRRMAERMITRARVDSVHNRRMIARRIHDGAILAKLFVVVARRFHDRPGGYTRVLKLGPRYGDAAEMVILELVDEDAAGPQSPSTTKAERTKTQPKADAAPQVAAPAPAAPDGPVAVADHESPGAEPSAEDVDPKGD
jgi:large subunit ribosomal protein L17